MKVVFSVLGIWPLIASCLGDKNEDYNSYYIKTETKTNNTWFIEEEKKKREKMTV